MNLSEIEKQIKNLPEKQINAILALIDHKTNADMEKVLSRFDVFDSKLNSIKESMQSEIRSVNDKIMTTRYIIGVGLGIIVLLITIFKFLG